MAELLVFTLLAAVAAAYPVLPEYRQLRVRFNLWTIPRFGFLVIMIGLILATYWGSVYLQSTNHDVIRVGTSYGTVEITSLQIESAQLLAVLGIVSLFAIVFLKPTVRIRNEENLLEILRDLYNREEYSTLVNLLQDNYQPLVNHPTKPKHPESAAVAFQLAYEDEYDSGNGLRAEIRQKKRLFRYYVNRLRYWTSNTAPDAADYTETLFLDPAFVKLYPSLASELGLRIIRDDSLEQFPKQKIVHRYLRTQLKTENSLLHRNLEHNTAGDGLYRYKLEEENRLVYALFSDFDKAENLNVYKPVGDKTRELIREQRREEFDRYNDQRLTDTRISDDFIFRDSIFVGIQFFDLLVKEAFHQQVEWHVWLSYYESFTREICRNYEITEYSDPSAEWPNDYSRLLYEMVSNMRDWVEMMEEELKSDVDRSVSEPPYVTDLSPGSNENADLPSDDESDVEDESSGEDEQVDSSGHSDHVQLGRISTGRDQRNIPEMTVIILFSCHKEILSTSEIPLQFQAYITEMIFLCLLDLRNYEEGSLQWRYSDFMLHCLEENLTGRRASASYRKHLKQVYHGNFGDRYDYGVRHEVSAKDTQMTGLVDDLDELIES
ncbi:hypothetical protein [Halorussus sp. MSC15.2]|uniref:hypothetical protein n=1 Tax=Halorussus sp. MSC15.2 TaxID=2283638 RepID=UPI0013D49D56|nr:hypothetical protein [Halorussus sp. MSC15.2]NEU56276.1 hypothetical protein [Halorussus sp. MSC15.2]